MRVKRELAPTLAPLPSAALNLAANISSPVPKAKLSAPALFPAKTRLVSVDWTT